MHTAVSPGSFASDIPKKMSDALELDYSWGPLLSSMEGALQPLLPNFYYVSAHRVLP